MSRKEYKTQHHTTFLRNTIPNLRCSFSHLHSTHFSCLSHQHLFEELQHVFIRKIMQHGTLCIDLIAGSWRVSVTWHMTCLLLVLFRPHAGETLQLDEHMTQVKGKKSEGKTAMWNNHCKATERGRNPWSTHSLKMGNPNPKHWHKESTYQY